MDLDLPRILVGLGFLVLAAAMDWRRRVVPDSVWVVMGGVALALVELDLLLANAPWFLHLMSAATAILYFGVFFGKPVWDETGFHLRPARLLVYMLAPAIVVLVWGSSGEPASRATFYRLLTVPAMIVLAHGLYEFGMLRGGADAKAVMALALLFPGLYPHVPSLPFLQAPPVVEAALEVWFPFAFIVLVNAAILFLAVPLLFFARNAAAGDATLPRAFFGYRVPLDAVPPHVWFMDRIEDGEPVHVYFPRRAEDREEQIRLLRAHGYTRAWVTPQLPFIVAMLAGYILAVVVGNLLLALFGGLG